MKGRKRDRTWQQRKTKKTIADDEKKKKIGEKKGNDTIKQAHTEERNDCGRLCGSLKPFLGDKLW